MSLKEERDPSGLILTRGVGVDTLTQKSSLALLRKKLTKQ